MLAVDIYNVNREHNRVDTPGAEILDVLIVWNRDFGFIFLLGKVQVFFSISHGLN